MAAAIIKFTQGGNNPPPDQALEGVMGTAVVCTNNDNAGVVTWLWELIDSPPGSTNAPGTISTTLTASFTPDIPGGYLIRLTTVDGSANTYVDNLAVLVPEDAIYSRIIPPFSAAATALNVGGQTRGWAPFMEDYLHVIDRIGDWSSSAPSNTNIPSWDSTAKFWKPVATSTIFTPGGDLSGTATSQKVVGISNTPTDTSMNAPADGSFIQKLSGKWAAISAAVLSASLVIASIPPGSNGQLLTTTGGVTGWAAAPAGFTAGGDLSGTSTSQTVIKINGSSVPAGGSLTTGNVLQVTGASALSYGAVNLGGGANFVTGALPVANVAPGTAAQFLVTNAGATAPAWVTMSGGATMTAAGVVTISTSTAIAGDVTGTLATSVVAKVNGATVPSSGSLTTGNVLQVSGASALSYGAINLAGGANFVTGQLPVANLVNGTAAQILVTNSGATAPAWVSLSGDSTITAAGVITNTKINGASVPAAGSLTTGNAAYVSGASALTYSALNLAGGSGWVTGQLPVGNLPNGTAAQILVTNSGATAVVFVSLSGDVTITAAGVASVGQLQGAIILSGTPSAGQVLTATSTTAAHWATPAITSLGGDLSGTATSQTVATLLGTTSRTKTSNYTVDASGNDFIIFADTSGGSWTLTLPAPAAGRVLIVRDYKPSWDAFPLTLAQHSSEKIDGKAASSIFNIKGKEIIITSDGTDWFTNFVPLFRALASNATSYYGGTASTSGIAGGGVGAVWSTQGSLAAVALTTTNLLTSTKRGQFTTTANTSGAVRDTDRLAAWRGNAAGLGGFRFICRFAFEAAGTSAVNDVLIGLIDSTAQQTPPLNWTTETTHAKIGMGFHNTSSAGGAFAAANWQIFASAAGSGATLVDLGSSFPIDTTSLLELELWALPDDSKVYYVVTNLSTGAITSGNISTNLPSNTTFLGPVATLNRATGGSGNTLFDVAVISMELPG